MHDLKNIKGSYPGLKFQGFINQYLGSRTRQRPRNSHHKIFEIFESSQSKLFIQDRSKVCFRGKTEFFGLKTGWSPGQVWLKPGFKPGSGQLS